MDKLKNFGLVGLLFLFAFASCSKSDNRTLVEETQDPAIETTAPTGLTLTLNGISTTYETAYLEIDGSDNSVILVREGDVQIDFLFGINSDGMQLAPGDYSGNCFLLNVIDRANDYLIFDADFTSFEVTAYGSEGELVEGTFTCDFDSNLATGNGGTLTGEFSLLR